MKLAALLLLATLGAANAQEDGSGAAPGLMNPGGLVLFYNDVAPLSFVTMTPKDLPPGVVLGGDVKGRSCQHGLAVPIAANFRATSLSAAAGDGSQRKALEGIKAENPDVAGLFDIRIDDHTFIILGIYKRSCVEITARAFRRAF
ncbi:MAG: hypothetical protein HY078_00800 [Elusimicrobia bacterium]|nr:hypothetical protein [Elusimicrobiota bacterium]